MNTGFRRDVEEICALLGCYAVCTGKSLLTFRDNLLVPSSGGSKIFNPEERRSLRAARNQPVITGVAVCNKNVGHPCSGETYFQAYLNTVSAGRVDF